MLFGYLCQQLYDLYTAREYQLGQFTCVSGWAAAHVALSRKACSKAVSRSCKKTPLMPAWPAAI